MCVCMAVCPFLALWWSGNLFRVTPPLACLPLEKSTRTSCDPAEKNVLDNGWMNLSCLWLTAIFLLFHQELLDEKTNRERKLYVIPFYEGKIPMRPGFCHFTFTSDFLLIILCYFWWKGLQRVVVFTENQRIFKKLLENESLRHAEQEVILWLHDMGISLVNNNNSQEISFIGITRWFFCV